MNIFQKFDRKKVLSFINQHQLYLIGIGMTLLLLIVYLASNRANEKVTVYKDESENSFSRVLPDSGSFYKKRDQIYKDKFRELEEKLAGIVEKIEKEQQKTAESKASNLNQLTPYNNEDYAIGSSSGTPPAGLPDENFFQQSPIQNTISRVPNHSPPATPGPSVISFSSDTIQEKEDPPLGPVIPSGSFVKAKILTGVEAPEGKTFPVLLQADYAFIGPNKSQIDLSGCFLIAKSTGNLSIERVEMQATKISCVSKSGEFFEEEVKGFISDNTDNSFAVIGEVNSKQDRVAGMAFLASIVEGIGNAVSRAQTSVTGNSETGQNINITGDERRYIAANGMSNAASTVTNWYLKHAESLLPTINVGSGRDVWVVMQDSTKLPKWFFEPKEKVQIKERALGRFLK